MWDKLGQYFTGRGFREVNLNRDGMRLFYASEGKAADPIWMIGDEALTGLSREQYRKFGATIRGIFEKQGFTTVSILTLFVTSRIEDCKEIGEDTAYWIVDGDYGRLIVYENQPEDFLGIRSVIENNLHFGGHSRNAEGAQTDLNHGNLRGGAAAPVSRGAVAHIDGGRSGAYIEESERQQRLRSSRRWSRYQGKSIVTFALIAINVIIFLLTDLFAMTSLMDKGMMSWRTVFTEHGYYRLFTCMFLHFGIDHLGGNMIALYAFGDVLERRLERVRFLVLYILSGLGASVVSCLYYHFFTDYDPFSAGASGAIYGLMGAMVAMLIMHPELRTRDYGMRFAVFAVYLVYTFVRSDATTNLAAHFGGLVCGAILFIPLDLMLTRRKRNWKNRISG